MRFVGVSYHDGQGFIVKKLLGVNSALNLSGAAICFLSGTTTQANVEDFFREKEMTFTPVMFDKLDDLVKAFDEGQMRYLYRRSVAALCGAPAAC